MVQIYNEPSFGKVLGTGIAQTLNTLAQNKMQQVQQRNQQKQTAQGLAALEGFSPEMAQALSSLDPQVLSKVLPGIQQSQREQQFAQQFQGQPGQQQMNPLMPEGLPAPRNSREALEMAKIGLKQKEVAQKLSAKEQQDIQKATQPFYDETLAKSEVAKDSEKRLSRMLALVNKGNLPHAGFYNVLKNLEENPASTAGAGAATGAATGAAIGSVVPIVGTTLGGLVGGAIGGFAGPVASLVRSSIKGKSPDIEEFEKLSADFIKDAKLIFGSRITDADLRAFMTMIPTLSNTDEGKKVIIRNLQNFNKANEVKAKVMKEIIKENGGKRPINLQELVTEGSQPELDKLANDFETGIS